MAYNMQFVGTYTNFKSSNLWEAHAEPKAIFFVWTGLYHRILTVDNLAKRGWEHNPLCKDQPETPIHLLDRCVFTNQVRSYIETWLQVSLGNGGAINSPPNLSSFFEACINAAGQEQRKRVADIIVYLWWNTWKERNRRIFESRELNAIQVAYRVKEDIALRQMAFQEAGMDWRNENQEATSNMQGENLSWWEKEQKGDMQSVATPVLLSYLI